MIEVMNKPRIAFALVAAVSVGTLVAYGSARGEGRTDDVPEHAAAEVGRPRVDPPDGDFAGEIRERVDAGSYTYMLVTTDAGAREWVVTLGAGAPVGTRVDIVNMGVRSDFRSRRLARTFDRLVFAIVRERG